MSFSIVLLAAFSNQWFLDGVNSDTLYLFELARHVIHPTLFFGQNLPAAPYFFPDMVWVVLLQGLTNNISLLHYLYSILFLTVFCSLIYKLLYFSLQDASLARLGTLAALANCFFVIVPHFYFLQEWLGAHLSIILFSLGFLWFYLINRENKLSFIQGLCVFILTFLVFISDNLVFAQLLFPVGILMGVDCLFKNTHKQFAGSLLIIFMLVIVCGVKIEVILHYFFDISISNNVSLFRIRKIAELDQTVLLAFRIFFAAIRQHALGFLWLLFEAILTIVLMVRLYWLNSKQPNLFRILAFFYGSILCNILLAILSGKLTALPYLRYLDTLFIFLPLGLVWVMMHLFKEKHHIEKWVLIVIFVGGAAGLLFHQPAGGVQFGFLSAPYPSVAQCMDQLSKQYHVQTGLAEYWNVRPVRMLTQENLQISQIDKRLGLQNFTDNKFYFQNNRNLYQFIMTAGLPKQLILQAVGAPDRVAFCVNQEVWLYLNKESHARLNQYFNQSVL